MEIELVLYLIMFFCTMKSIFGFNEIDQAIDFIEENTCPMSTNSSRRLATNLRCFRDRVSKKISVLMSKVKFVFNWRDPNCRYRDSISRMVSDAENYVLEDEAFFIIGQYRECLVKELIAGNVIFSSSKMRLRLNDDLNNKNSVTYITVNSIATLIAYSNAIWFMTHQALHILSNLENAGAGNEAVKSSLRDILKDKDCIYKNCDSLLYGTASYCIDTNVIQTVSRHVYDLAGLLELVENKSKWILLKNTGVLSSDNQKKEESVMITNNSLEPMVTTEEMTGQPENPTQLKLDVVDATTMADATETIHDTDLSDEEKVSQYITPKMIAQLILMSVEMGRLNSSNFVDFVADMVKWGLSLRPFFESEAFSDNYTEFARKTVFAASDPHVGEIILPLVNMSGYMKLNPETYFNECIIETAITLEVDHDPKNVIMGRPLEEGRVY